MKIALELYKSYGRYVNTSKMVPSLQDGLIPVWRRLLLGAHTIAKDFTKTVAVFGHVIRHWHPHSENLTSTAAQLVDNEFLEGKGNWGSKIGIEPMECAAPRYTSIKISNKIESLCFKYIDSVDWVTDELDPEPIYLPTLLPLCI